MSPTPKIEIRFEKEDNPTPAEEPLDTFKPALESDWRSKFESCIHAGVSSSHILELANIVGWKLQELSVEHVIECRHRPYHRYDSDSHDEEEEEGSEIEQDEL